MSAQTKIEWTDATWNPWHGCSKVSPGCKHCYMYRDKRRYGQDPNIVVRSKTMFREPLKWKAPRRVFTCSWSDFFHADADPWRDEAWDIIRRTPHTYQILTKRADRIIDHLPHDWPLRNVWLGVSIETENERWRADHLVDVPGEFVRFLSLEPLLSELDISRYLPPWSLHVDWVIVGGESGPHARPMNPEWVRLVRDQTVNRGRAFFFKQWGEWAPWDFDSTWEPKLCTPLQFFEGETERECQTVWRVGKKRAGRSLDCRTWDEFPES